MKIILGIPTANRAEAAALYWEAFGQKLGFVLGPKHRALQFITSVLRTDHGICAVDDDGHLLGVVGFKTSKGALVNGSFKDLQSAYGWVGATIRLAMLASLERNQGVGTALLDAISAEARRRGYAQVRLDVIDSNPRARALYLKEGFKELGTSKLGVLRFAFNFRAATTMVRDV